MNNKKFDIAAEVTSQLLVKIHDTGLLPWQKEWHAIHYQNALSGHKYRGINVIILSLFGTDTHYITYKGAESVGGFIAKGSKSLPIVFWAPFEKVDPQTGEVKKRFFLRYYRVFPLTAVCFPLASEGKKIERKGVKLSVFNPIESAERIVKTAGIAIEHGGNRACYSPSEHKIRMPHPEQFTAPEAYYLTLFHEITHALHRDNGEKIDGNTFGSDPYAREELIAEIGANFFASYCGINSEKYVSNSAAYLKGWSEKLQSEPELIVKAAGKAHARFNLILKKLGELDAPETSDESTEEKAA